MNEYELYVPLTYNDGSRVEPEKLVRLREQLHAQFGGQTFFPQSNHGSWTAAGVTFRDEIVIYRVLTNDARSARRFFRHLKEELKGEFRQQEILIIEKAVEAL